MLIGLFPLFRMTYLKGDITKELVISEVEKRSSAPTIDIVGLITNRGTHKWSNISIEAEFYDGSGAFLDEKSDYLRTEIPAGAKEHFKISLRTPDPRLRADDTKMVVKIAGGHSPPF
jgi:hypothetical protein